MMRNKLIVAAIATLLTAGPALAENGGASKEEKIGVGTGAVIGAVAGGPVGFIVGAAIGAKIGDEFHERNDKVVKLDSSLNGSQLRVADLERNVDALNGDIDEMGAELQKLRHVARPELLALMQAGIEMDLLFRTDEHVLADTTGDRLRQLATGLAAMPDVFIQLDAFADERGDESYNQKLSVRRAEHVRNVLTSSGVDAARIKLIAHGESPAADTNIDSYALERRVSLTLYVDDAPSFAANPR